VQAGTVHLFRGWFADPRNVMVQHLYQEVEFLRRGASLDLSGSLQEQLADNDPLVRFTAVTRLKNPSAGQTELLLKALRKETDWVVARNIVQVLGHPGNNPAVPFLVDLLKDSKRGLDVFAAQSLGRIGPGVGPSMDLLATGKDPRLATSALQVLAQFDDPASVPTLLKLTQSSSAVIRGQAARALARRHSPAVSARLIEMLKDEDLTVIAEACNALGQAQDRTAIKPLVELVVRSVTELKNNRVREAAGDALESITGKQFSVFHNLWKQALDHDQL
jgi:HEAT repeat protein